MHTAKIGEMTLLRITPGERAALQLLAEGKGRIELAASLEVPEVEVDARLRALFSKMGVRTAREAADASVKRGLVDSPAVQLTAR
jgi:DNA-binding NarL/FixJ family response regulator